MARVPAVAHSGPSERTLGRNNDSDVEAINLSSKSRIGEDLDDKSNNATVSEKQDHHEKPTMPRAKRVISFDDQTSRLSRSKLVIV